MNNIFIGILSIFIALAILCLQAVIDHTPPLYAVGLCLAIFSIGFIFGENQSDD